MESQHVLAIRRNASQLLRPTRAITKQHAPLFEGMEHAGLSQDRRALAAIPKELIWQWLDESQLQLSFSLAAGYCATSVMREILDAQEPDRYKPE